MSSGLVRAEASEEPDRAISKQPHQRVGRLANGLAYFIERSGKSDEKIRFDLIVRVGNAQSLPREREVAHVVEHILFQQVPDQDFKNSIGSRLARFGGVAGADWNAYTSPTDTRYFLKAPAKDPAALAAGLDILHEWMLPRALTDAEIDRERKAVIEESRRSPLTYRRQFEIQYRTWFNGHPILDHPFDPIGTLSATPATIRSLYRQWYTPRNMAVVIVGDVDPDMILREVTARFGPLAVGDPSPRAVDLRLNSLGGHYVPITGTGQGETRLDITYKYHRAPAGSPRRVREEAVARIAERLMRVGFGNIVSHYAAPVTSGGITISHQANPARSAGTEIVFVNGGLRPGASREGLADILRLLATIRRDGFSASDIDRARRELLAEHDDAPSTGEIASRWISYFLQGAFNPTPADVRAAIARITPADVNDTVAGWLNPANRDIFVIHPQSAAATVPNARELPKLISDAERAPPTSLSPPEIKEPAFVPFVPARALRSTGTPESGGYVRWTLPRSGATLLFKHTNAPQLRILLRRPGGAARFNPAQGFSALAAEDVVRESGLGGLDKFELARFIAERNITVGPLIRVGHEGVTASGPVAQLPLILRLVRAQLLQPQCREAAFRDYVANATASLTSLDANVADRAALSEMIATSVSSKSQAGVDELAELNFETVCRQYSQMLGDTRGMTIVVEGDLLPDDAHAAIVAALDIPVIEEAPPIQTRSLVETKAGREVLKRGSSSTASVVLILQRAITGDEQAGLIVGQILSRRMQQRLREVEKGTYSASAGFSVQTTPFRAVLSIVFDCDPKNVDRLIAAANDELTLFRSAGPNDDELDAAKRRQSPQKSLHDISEIWINRGTLTPPPPPSDVEVRDWVKRNIDPSRLRAFVRIPETP